MILNEIFERIMPLPPALLARLKQRGLVPDEPEEEIIAESYDEESGQRMKYKPSLVPQEGHPAPGCPNKNNIYHRYSLYRRPSKNCH